jgi:hypothetical protein
VGGGWSSIIGLGLTQLIDALAALLAEEVGSGAGTRVKIVAFLLDAVIAGIVAGFGVFARKRLRWAFIIGMILYALDGLIFLWVGDYLSIGFHLFALYGLYRGVNALGHLAALEQVEGETMPRPA